MFSKEEGTKTKPEIASPTLISPLSRINNSFHHAVFASYNVLCEYQCTMVCVWRSKVNCVELVLYLYVGHGD